MIDEFVERVVEGYLLGDLDSMANLKTAGEYGGVGYPMLATTVAGMELLGRMLWPGERLQLSPSKRGNKLFLYYWDNYLAAERPVYTGLGPFFRQMVRNGINHDFVAKGSIWVGRGTGQQLLIDEDEKSLYIDCIVFFEDFKSSYSNRVRPILDGDAARALTDRVQIQKRLGELEEEHKDDWSKAFSHLDLAALDSSLLRTSDAGPPTTTTTPITRSGPTGGTGGTAPFGEGPTGPRAPGSSLA